MCRKRILMVLLLLGTIFVVTACGATIIKGSGNLITETRQVSNFDSIDLSGSGEVIVTQGGSESLTIETDDNVMEHVKAEVQSIQATLISYKTQVDTVASFCQSVSLKYLKNDPFELNNLYGNKGFEKITKELKDEILRLQKQYELDVSEYPALQTRMQEYWD